MNKRVQRVLDDELPRAALTAQEASELLRMEAMIDGVLRSVPAPTAPDLAPAILRRISAVEHGALPEPKRPSWFSWLWRPRPIALQWRPVYALVAVTLLAFTLMNTPRIFAPAQAPEGSPARAQVLVEFRLEAPDANAVALAGGFTEWQPVYTMKKTTPGVWTVVVPLDPGVHEYAFIVDGHRWVPDPAAPAVRDGFGGVNSRIAVLSPDSRRQL